MNGNISIENLSVSYSAHEVLSEISLEIKKGEFLSVVGKSGVGKTTLLNAIAGFVHFQGEIKKPEKIAMLFQNYSLFPWMTARQNISGSGQAKGSCNTLY